MGNGRRFWGYLRNRIKWYALILLSGLLMAAVMLLNGIPFEEIGYGLALCLAFTAVVAAADYYRYDSSCRKLLALRHSVTLSLEGMPEPTEPVEQIYQELLQILSRNKTWLENEARERERDLTEYYTMWVHQIKTPIAAQKLLLDEMEEGERREEMSQELFRIQEYAQMALQYMRLESESTDYVLRSVELDELIRPAVRKYAKQFIRKKLSLVYEPLHTAVLTDGKWLGFVVEHLLSNAIKYTPKGSIRIGMEGGYLVICDTGIGIRQEDLPRVCEKGYTGYNGHADKRSTGIGLYLCSRILKRLGHTFSITSEEGCGTRVMIGFPASEDAGE